MRHRLDCQTEVESPVGDSLLVHQAYRGDSDDKLFHSLLGNKPRVEDITGQHHGDTVELLVHLGEVVVDKRHYTIFIAEILLKGVICDNSRGTGSIDYNIETTALALEVLIVDIKHGEARQQHKHHQNSIEHGDSSV